MPDFNDLYRKHNEDMEDFWSRRSNASKHERTIHIFGHAVVFSSNHLKVLDSVSIAEEMYSVAHWTSEPAWRIQLTVRSQPESAPPPGRLVDLVNYTGAEGWLSIDLLEWGNCFVDMKRGEAYAVLSVSLAENPELVCQVLINTILTNLITRSGFSMLHASALVKEDRILLLQAPHGTGKSTTALRLLLNGYKLISDSMVYIGEHDGELCIGGFPVGRIKLRTDMLPLFPSLAAGAVDEPVRNETKHRVDLKHVDPTLSMAQIIVIRHVEYCLLERWDNSESSIESLAEAELWPEIMANSLHYDTPELWRENLRKIELLLKQSSLHRLRIGTSEAGILKSVDQLWEK